MDQLKYCANHAIFLRVEAKFFVSLLYLNYENDLKSASNFASQLYREFSNNPFYTGKYLEILLYDQKYFFAPVLLGKLRKMNDPFADMQYHLFQGMYLEKSENRLASAKKEYQKALDLSVQYGDFTEHYNAIAYMGLGRINKKEGNNSQAEKYFRLARNVSVYDYVIEDKWLKLRK